MSRREQMIKSIKEGNSILLFDGMGGFKQYTIANIEDLPTDAELALGNAHEEKQALEAIEKQFAQLEAAKQKLVASQKKKEAEVVKVAAYQAEEVAAKPAKKAKAAKKVVEETVEQE